MNNIIEQDHRFIKRKIKPGLGFFSYPTAWRTIREYEAMHMIWKGQIGEEQPTNLSTVGEKIELLGDERPIPPTELNCGDIEEIEITYLANSEAPSASVRMDIFTSAFWDGAWQQNPQSFNIILSGSPPPG